MVFFVIKSEYIYFPPEVIFFSAGNELSISMKVFLFLIYLTSFFHKKSMGFSRFREFRGLLIGSLVTPTIKSQLVLLWRLIG